MLPRELLHFFTQLIKKELGIVYQMNNEFQLEARLDEIARHLKMNDVSELWSACRNGVSPEIMKVIADLITNKETSFFRDMKAFHSLKDTIIPSLCYKGRILPIRIWCAATSFGQEPYTLSMILSEYTSKDPSAAAYEIMATDISRVALERAKRGVYSQLEVQRGLPAAYLLKYFTRVENEQWQVNEALKKRITFQRQNLIEPFSHLGQFDLVLCRNVLIYQPVENKIEIIKRISSILKPNGYLLLGSAETLVGLSTDYEQVNTNGSVYYRSKAAVPLKAA